MLFEWDERKATANLAKHHIAFDQAITVFKDPNRLTYADHRTDYGEPRHNTVGIMDEVVVLCVTHTNRADVTRLISARPASRRERKLYHAHCP
ncbi:BrnT family toxin [Synoicihabitans lomoniglobus]|uniref:BrnT family toxin n=1 Tax=Synoicihabitans lomoniglobus TaxID=2909285 RepID=UPI0031F31989